MNEWGDLFVRYVWHLLWWLLIAIVLVRWVWDRLCVWWREHGDPWTAPRKPNPQDHTRVWW